MMIIALLSNSPPLADRFHNLTITQEMLESL